MTKNKIMFYFFWLLLLGSSALSETAQMAPQKTRKQSLFFMPIESPAKPAQPIKISAKSPAQSLYVVDNQIDVPASNKKTSAEQRSSSENDTARQIRLNRIILDINGYLGRFSPYADKSLREEIAAKFLEDNYEYLDLNAQTKEYILEESQKLREIKSPKAKKESGTKFDPRETYFFAMGNVGKQKFLPTTTTIQKASTAPNIVQTNPVLDKDSDPNLTINI